MNWIDTVLLSIVGLSVLISLLRGFVKEALSLSTWVLALWIAIVYSDALSLALKNQIAVPSMRNFIAFIILFVATIFVGSIVNYLIGKVIRKTPFSGPDRLIGSFFGLARGLLVCSVLIFILDLTDLVAEPSWHESKLLPKVKVISDKFASYLPESFHQVLQEGKSLKASSQSEPIAPAEPKSDLKSKLEDLKKGNKLEKLEKIEKIEQIIDKYSKP